MQNTSLPIISLAFLTAGLFHTCLVIYKYFIKAYELYDSRRYRLIDRIKNTRFYNFIKFSFKDSKKDTE